MAKVVQKCCVFIDNSNLFIEGQKFYARLMRLQATVSQDIRFRIDIGMLVRELVGEREQIFAKLYGSEPPPNDSLWKEIRNRGILVDTFQRNAEDYEKELDTSLTADVTEQACCLTSTQGSVTFIIIGGDRDYLPSYDKVLKHKWRLEIAAWKNCLSQKVKSYAESNVNKGTNLILLDELAARNPSIYFLADKWTAKKRLPRDRTIVFEYSSARDDRQAKKLNAQVSSLIRFPCWYLHNPDTDPNLVMVIIITDQKEGRYETNRLYDGIKQKFHGKNCKRIIDFVKFKQEQHPIFSSWVFKYEELEEGDDEERRSEQDETKGEDDDGGEQFEVVGPGLRRKQVQKYSEQCKYRFVCRRGKNCSFAHTDDEKLHFKRHPEKLGKLYKAKFCVYYSASKCKCTAKDCCYAHDPSEARCYNCDPGGLVGNHWMDQCPNKKS